MVAERLLFQLFTERVGRMEPCLCFLNHSGEQTSPSAFPQRMRIYRSTPGPTPAQATSFELVTHNCLVICYCVHTPPPPLPLRRRPALRQELLTFRDTLQAAEAAEEDGDGAIKVGEAQARGAGRGRGWVCRGWTWSCLATPPNANPPLLLPLSL